MKTILIKFLKALNNRNYPDYIINYKSKLILPYMHKSMLYKLDIDSEKYNGFH